MEQREERDRAVCRLITKNLIIQSSKLKIHINLMVHLLSQRLSKDEKLVFCVVSNPFLTKFDRFVFREVKKHLGESLIYSGVSMLTIT